MQPQISALIVTATLAAGALAAGFSGSYVDATRIKVIDGDTVRIGVETIRLDGFDTPETKRFKCIKERRHGQKATKRLRELLNRARQIRFVRTGRDRYGRTLAEFTVDGADIGGILIAEGLAVEYHAGRKKHSWC